MSPAPASKIDCYWLTSPGGTTAKNEVCFLESYFPTLLLVHKKTVDFRNQSRLCCWTPYGNLASCSWFVFLWSVSCRQTFDLEITHWISSFAVEPVFCSLVFGLVPLEVDWIDQNGIGSLSNYWKDGCGDRGQRQGGEQRRVSCYQV